MTSLQSNRPSWNIHDDRARGHAVVPNDALVGHAPYLEWGQALARRAAMTPVATSQKSPGKIVEPREASTLVLMRDRNSGSGQPEVLLAQRHSKDAFAAGAFVFPGGVLEPEDSAQAALKLSPRLLPEEVRERLAMADPAERAMAYLIAAIRETFEEVGVLLAKTADGEEWRPEEEDRDELNAVRERLRAGELAFNDWMAERGLCLATEDLVYFAHWVTPAQRPKRFDTRFFLARADSDCHVEPDRLEIVNSEWLTPREAIDAEREGKMRMVNATVINLEILESFSSTARALVELGTRDVQVVKPKLIFKEDGGYTILHPWDPDYDAH